MKTSIFRLIAVFAASTPGFSQNGVDAQLASGARQREQTATAMVRSIRRQKAALHLEDWRASIAPVDRAAGFRSPEQGWDVACAQMTDRALEELVSRAAAEYRVDRGVVTAVIRRESDALPCAVSGKGAMGLMQLMPDTASALKVNNAFDPEENVFAGTRLLRRLLDRYSGDLALALGAYNAGTSRVDAGGAVPAFPETVAYVDSILDAVGISARPPNVFPEPRR